MNLTPIAIAKRVIFAAAIGVVLTRVLPSLADENTPIPPTIEEVSVAPSVAPATDAPVPTPAPSDGIPTAGPLISATPEASASPSSEPTSIPEAVVTVRVPSVLKVDPRAQIAAINPLHISSANDLLVCINSSKSAIDLPLLPETVLANQNVANHLVISGKSGAVAQSLSSLRLIGSPSGATLIMRFVAVTEPNLNEGLCGQPNAVAQVNIAALGLEQGLVKAGVSLAKKR